MAEKRLYYPVIITECNDEAGHYYGVSSPNIPGMVTDGNTMEEALLHTEDAIATMLADMADYPAVQDPTNWHLGSRDRVMWIWQSGWISMDEQSGEISPFQKFLIAGQKTIQLMFRKW